MKKTAVRLLLLAAAWCGGALRVPALSEAEVLLLVNRRSQASLRVANEYAALRGIPEENVVFLDLPESCWKGKAEITPEAFTRQIWEPVLAAEKRRGIEGRILAWVYSVDFPIRVRNAPKDRRQMSVCGLTFTRNRLPAPEMIEKGRFFSRLFLGPNERLRVSLPPLSLDWLKNGLGDVAKVPDSLAYLRSGLKERMPLPAMMLGYTGEKGMTVEEVLAALKRGREADATRPKGTVFFVTGEDVRAKCRAWQFPGAEKELRRLGIPVVETNAFPAGAKEVLGLMMGAAAVHPEEIGSFVPGAMADHLTSWGAEFQRPQTKVTEWLKAGATVTAGTVVEPYSLADKFPSARFFVHYASGCTALESFYYSIACPLQILPLGDPLTRPFARPVRLKLLGVSRLEKKFTYMAESVGGSMEYLFLLDGREVRGWSTDPACPVDPAQLADGYHELRCVARTRAIVRSSVSAVKPFLVPGKGRVLSLRPVSAEGKDGKDYVEVTVAGPDRPKKVRLMCGLRVLDERPWRGEKVRLVLDERKVGEGPNRIRAVGVYADGMNVSSPPLAFTLRFDDEERAE